MWFYLALTSTLISALSVVFSKRSLKTVSPTLLLWGTFAFAVPMITIFLIIKGIPSFSHLFIAAICFSVLFYTLSRLLQYKVMQKTDLSFIYPLVSLGAVVTLLVSFLPPLNERPNAMASIGVLVVIAGCYVLNVGQVKEGIWQPFKVLINNRLTGIMIMAIILEGSVTYFDKIAINNTIPSNSTFVLVIEDALIVIGLLPVMAMRNIGWVSEIKKNYRVFILLGVLEAVSSIGGFLAIGSGNIGLVSALFKIKTIFVLLFSYLMFDDKPKTETIIGSFIMILGVVLIKIYS